MRPARRRLPLRIGLTLVSTVVIIAVAVTIGTVTVTLLTRHLTDQLDRQVGSAAMRLIGPPPGAAGGRAELPVPSGDALCNARPPVDGPAGRQPDDSVFATYSAAGGAVSAAVRGDYPDCAVLTAVTADVLRAVPVDGTTTTVSIDGFGRYRVVAHAEGGHVFVSGVSTAGIDATRGRLLVVVAAVTGSAVLLGGVVVWWSVRRALAPLEMVAATARAAAEISLDTGVADLPVRVPTGLTDPRTEAGTVGTALNRLLDHVDTALTVRADSENKIRAFVADASHELRTPLTSIRGYAELARRHPDDPEGVQRALGRIESESVRMSGLVEDLLLLARLDTERPLATGPVDLAALVREAVADAQFAGPEHRWSVTVPSGPVWVSGDRPRLQQVVTNLLTNARVHTPPGTTVTASVTATAAGVAQLQVIDDGPGVDPHVLPRVFDRFMRADDSRTRTTGSTGLGLAIVEGLVLAHGGHIDVDSVAGRTAFTVTLPVDPQPGGSHSERTGQS